jgi:hypothetical protein
MKAEGIAVPTVVTKVDGKIHVCGQRVLLRATWFPSLSVSPSMHVVAWETGLAKLSTRSLYTRWFDLGLNTIHCNVDVNININAIGHFTCVRM